MDSCVKTSCFISFIHLHLNNYLVGVFYYLIFLGKWLKHYINVICVFCRQYKDTQIVALHSTLSEKSGKVLVTEKYLLTMWHH